MQFPWVAFDLNKFQKEFLLTLISFWLIPPPLFTISRVIEKGFSRDSAEDDLPIVGLSSLPGALEG